MALSQEDLISAVVKLNELTRQKVIEWQPCAFPAKGPGNDNPFGFNRLLGQFEAKSSFEAAHDGRILRITQYTASSRLSFGDSYKYLLDVRDQEGSVIFEFPDVAGIGDLFHSVQTQIIDIEGFIKKLATG